MIDKFLTIGKKCVSSIHPAPKTSMKIVYLYGAGLAFITFLFFAGWIWDWQKGGDPNLPTLLSFFKEYTAATVVAAVTFLTVFHVDKNGDGRPDAAEIQATQSKKEGTK